MEVPPMELHEVFLEELETIADPRIKELATDVLKSLEQANRFFYRAPASSSNRFHPPCCNVTSGLLRHVKRAVGLGHHLCTAYGLHQRERDIITAALLLHDIWKNDFNKHASRAGDYILEIIYKHPDRYSPVGVTALSEIVKAIRHHMGLWTEPEFKKPIPEYSLVELVVYTADYISSRSDVAMKQDACDLPKEIELDLVK
jgi:HD superfamily phosphohydrolase YqeK